MKDNRKGAQSIMKRMTGRKKGLRVENMTGRLTGRVAESMIGRMAGR